MNYFYLLYGIVFCLLGYILIQNVYFHQSATMPDLVTRGLIEPVQDVIQPIADYIADYAPRISKLSDWIPFPKRRYSPNKYGYGGLDPSTGKLRKGGDGMDIPDEVNVGWWNGEISYDDRQLSPVHDSEDIPVTTVAPVGWWGDDMAL